MNSRTHLIASAALWLTACGGGSPSPSGAPSPQSNLASQATPSSISSSSDSPSSAATPQAQPRSSSSDTPQAMASSVPSPSAAPQPADPPPPACTNYSHVIASCPSGLWYDPYAANGTYTDHSGNPVSERWCTTPYYAAAGLPMPDDCRCSGRDDAVPLCPPSH